jgi:2-hydroxymuconate-semialdehyde hydrolase
MRRALLVLAAALAAAVALPPLWFALFPPARPELPPAGRRVEVAPGIGVNLIEEGAGPPVVLVHGHPGSAYDWQALMRELAARGRHVIAYDRLGYGRSDARASGAYTVDANADELLALLAAENLRGVVLVGWSYGGGVAIAAARRDPSRIDRLVLVGSVGPGIEGRSGLPPLADAFLRHVGLPWLGSVPPLFQRLSADFLAGAFAPEPVPPTALAQMDANFARPHTLTSFRSEAADLDGTADLDPGPIARPILVVQGGGDLLVPRAIGEELHRRAKGSELWIVPGGSHALPVTHPRELAERIAAFGGG